jgi:hypothetical protein
MACISPSDLNFDENLQTLMYALKTNNINNSPIKNIDHQSIVFTNLKKT